MTGEGNVPSAEKAHADQELEARLTPLDPRMLKVLRIRGAITGLFVLVPLAVLDFTTATALPPGLITLAGLAFLLATTLWLPGRRYSAWGWTRSADELHVASGLLVRSRTVVPFARVQHIDTSQGPIERNYGLATLTLHTAGTRGAMVALPGLAREAAEALRDDIRG